MTTDDGLPLVMPSAVDPDCECVLVDPDAARAALPSDTDSTGDSTGASVGDSPGDSAGSGEPLCHPGYVPRRSPRSDYDLDGKEIITTDPPVQNPEPPPV